VIVKKIDINYKMYPQPSVFLLYMQIIMSNK
jgi:hypothetical protein